jgi:hypothetical protein
MRRYVLASHHDRRRHRYQHRRHEHMRLLHMRVSDGTRSESFESGRGKGG